MSESPLSHSDLVAEVEGAIERVTTASDAHVKSAEALIKWTGVTVPALVAIGALVTEDRLATFFDQSGAAQATGSVGLVLLVLTLVAAFGVSRPRRVSELTPADLRKMSTGGASAFEHDVDSGLFSKKLLLLDDLRNAAHDRGVVLRGALTLYVLSMAVLAVTLVLAANHSFTS
jgi:hypothetical protein